MKKTTYLYLIAALFIILPFVGGFTNVSAAENTFEACTDGIDNDENFLVDSSDPACAGVEAPEESLVVEAFENTLALCTDGIDNDGDFLIDLSDPDCAPFTEEEVVEDVPAVENTLALCTDGLENDGDFLIDVSDPDCAPFFASEDEGGDDIVEGPAENTLALCTDGIDNDEDFLIDLSDPECAPFYEESVATSTPPVEESARRSGGRRSGGGSSVPSEGSVLGAFDDASCKPVLTTYIKFGQANDVYNVAILQFFLNDFMKSGLTVNGVYDQATLNAVNLLQSTYSDKIIKPWVDLGLLNTGDTTGYVYKSTQWFINDTLCPSAEVPFPLLP